VIAIEQNVSLTTVVAILMVMIAFATLIVRVIDLSRKK